MQQGRSTGQVVRQLRQDGFHQLTEGRVQGAVRHCPALGDIPVVGARRRWRESDVEALIAYLEQRGEPRVAAVAEEPTRA